MRNKMETHLTDRAVIGPIIISSMNQKDAGGTVEVLYVTT